MKKFIVFFREPDGRTIHHDSEAIKSHQEKWKNWFVSWGAKGTLDRGSGLTLNGRLVMDKGNTVVDGIYQNGTEIIGGYLLLNATDLDDAASIVKTCPVFDFDGYAEIRELQTS